MRKSGSKEKLPKPTSIVNDIMPLNSEKESSNIPSNDGSLKKKERDIKQATPQDTSITDASNKPTDDDNVWISSPKKISPKSHLSKTTFGSHQIKPHVPHREPPIPSPRGDRVKKLVSSMEARAPPTPPKIPKPLQESASSNNMTGPPTTPKKDIVYSSNQSLSLAKTSDWRRRLDKPPPPPPLIINRDRFSHSKAAIPSAISLRKQEIPEENHHFKAPVPQSNINDNDGTASQKPNSPLLVTTIENDPHHDEVPTPGGIKSNLPVLPKLPPKTFLPDIAPPPPPKKNILPPPVVPYNLARHKKLIPIPEPVRLSLEEDYPNRTLEPTDVFHVEYRERTHFRGVQWCFDEYSGIYHKKIPGLHQTLPHFQNTDGNTTLLSRSQSTMMQPPRKLRRSKLSLSMHNEPIYSPSMDSVKWSTPTSVREVRLMRKESKKLRDKKAQLSLCRVLIEATADVKEFNPMMPHFTTKYSPRDLRKKKKKDMVFDEVLVLEAQRLLKGLVTGRDFPDAEAQFLLANCYGMGGLGFPLDRERAFRLYIHASKQNHVESIYRAAVCYELGIGTNQDNSRALSFYRKAATYSHVGSMYKLGIILLRGYCGQSKSIREALSWLQRAAACSSENPHALHALAMLQLEEGCPDTNLIADAAYAIDLLHAAARLDYVPSQIKLGELYEAGRWVEEDDAQSIYWYTKAAQAGNPDAALALSCWYLTGSCGILEQSDQEALLWAYKAATSKVADRWTVAKALFLVGIYIENGATSSREDATPWFRRAAALGHKGAADKMKGKNVKAICYTE
ncbi:HCP-like protein [Backusella circina FSU 941]|nr:HCP-like protein [Backusella circina FSU 941]